ncbi:MAG: DUF3857 domain-containing transglutaminase family protein [Tabrizicola sp.]|nr:DUF3857 domain-containing transglutaminase family protein [Tabrizicola sp.]
MRILSVPLSILLLFSAPALAQGVAIATEPDWVEPLELPPESPEVRAEAVGGAHYIASDHQVVWIGETKHSYGRTVAEVTDRAGLEELATIRLDFDPEFEQVSLVRLRILRDGDEIDLMDGVHAEVYRRETRLDEGIIDGTLTAVIQVPGLRVGDVIDHATVLTSRPIVAGVGRSGWSVLEWSVPVVLSRTLLTWPESLPLELGPLPETVSYRSWMGKDGLRRHEWRREGHVPLPVEEAVPPEAEGAAFLRFGETRDWTGLVRALAPHYDRDYPLPADWEARIVEIAKAHVTPEARAYAALRMVQDEIRYVSLSVGTGGYFARSPEEVVASGFGDCKDKSLLLRVMLSRLGVAAVVALTDLDAGYGLPAELPMPGVFDHMILRATLAGHPVWMDPTGSHEGGGLGTAAELDYGYALPLLSQGPAALERMEVTAEGVWSQDVREEFSFTLLGMFLKVESLHLSGSADGVRARWATTPVSQISREFLDYYQNRYPGLVVARPPQMTDDREANRVTVIEHYFLPYPALDQNGLREDFVFATEGLVDRYPDRLSGPRRQPMEVNGPWIATHRIEVIGGPIEFEPPEDVTISNPAFEFTLRGEASAGGNMVLAWRFEPKVHAVPAELVADVIEDVNTLRNATWYSWDLTPE